MKTEQKRRRHIIRCITSLCVAFLHFTLRLSDGAVGEKDNTDVRFFKKSCSMLSAQFSYPDPPPLSLQKAWWNWHFQTLADHINEINDVLHDSVTQWLCHLFCFTASYPNPPMLEADVPSPNTLPAVEPMLLAKEGLEPNAAAPPNAGEPPKEGGLPNTGADPKPAIENVQGQK